MNQNDKFDWDHLFIKSISVFTAVIMFGLLAGLSIAIWRFALGL